MANWMGMTADWLRPIYEVIRTGVLGGGYVQVDETPIKYLVPGNGKTKQGYLWTCHRPGGDTIFDWQTHSALSSWPKGSRAAACLEKIVPVDFKGVLPFDRLRAEWQSDGYAAYGAFARERGQAIILAGCWAHARRGFHEALQSAPRDALLILRQIGNLYAIERRQRARRAGPRLRALAREVESRPILERLGHTLRRWKLRRRHPFGCAQGTRCRKARWEQPSTTPWASGPR